MGPPNVDTSVDAARTSACATGGTEAFAAIEQAKRPF